MRDYEGTSLDTLRQMVTMGMGIAFLPALYIRSEIHRPQELRVERLQGEEIYRTHALVWRKPFPASALFRDVAEQIRAFVADELSDELTVAPRRRASRRTKA